MMVSLVNSSTTTYMRKFGHGVMIFKKRKQNVVVDGTQSSLFYVVSGVPQGTVLGPLLFLLHINNLPSVVSFKVRLFLQMIG